MCVSWIVPPETVPQLFFRPFGAESVPTPMSPVRTTPYPRLAPWAVILRRFAAMRGSYPTFELALEVRHSLLRDSSLFLAFAEPKRWAKLVRPSGAEFFIAPGSLQSRQASSHTDP